ncbi:hypothetical protein C8R43DRAFT_1236240 [Mycena crocata]|nr:hypothetical protein C8R43DRAFT_1236240 [Mycena crocata]
MSEVTDADDPFSPTSDEMDPPDLIIRSSDLVDFHVHKAILVFGSVFFKHMFSFPAPAGDSRERNDMRDGKIIVVLPENSKTVHHLLILCYPRFASNQTVVDLDGIDAAYESAGKYQIPGGQQRLRQLLEDPRLLSREPHRVFTIACHHGLEEITKLAAMETLKSPVNPWPVFMLVPPEFKLISAHQFWQLQQFYNQCTDTVYNNLVEFLFPQAVKNGVWSYEDTWWDPDGHGIGCGPEVTENQHSVYQAGWFREHIHQLREVARRCPDPQLLQNTMAEVTGPALISLSKCPQCVQLASHDLRPHAHKLNATVTRLNTEILDKFSFVA